MTIKISEIELKQLQDREIYLEKELIPSLVIAVDEAAALGDLSENEDWSTSKALLSSANEELKQIKEKLSDYELVLDADNGPFREGTIVSITITDDLNAVAGADVALTGVCRYLENKTLILRLGTQGDSVTAGVLDIKSALGKMIYQKFPGDYIIQHATGGTIHYKIDYATEEQRAEYEKAFPTPNAVLDAIYAAADKGQSQGGM